MTVAEGGGIFVSYRRQETSHLAGRLYDRLADRFGEGQVFIDVDTIEPGVDFAEEIGRAVATCKVLLAVIGPTWLTATDQRGRRRLDDPDDIVRLEIEAALARGVRVIPILVEGAPMPGREDLPGSLVGLARRNALLIRHESFRSDAGRLVTAIQRVLAATSGAVDQSPPAAKAEAPPVPRNDRTGSNAPSETARKEAVNTAEVSELSGDEQTTRIEREIAVCKRFDVPPEKGLNREEASRAFSDNGINPRASGSWIRHGWIIREGDRRWLSDKGRDWILASAPAAMAVPSGPDAHGVRSAGNAVGDVARKGSGPAGNDPGRAAGLLTDAERIARSIKYKPDKASALSRVAEALAATDPDRAARLRSDAERIASAVVGVIERESALSGVAEALAATDPDRAERIALSITDKNLTVWALKHVAEALAATDPDRAARLLTDTERIARSITSSEYSKESALSGVAGVLAATDPDRAERIANSITNKSLKASALSGVAGALAATDPDRAAGLLADAERIASSLTHKDGKPWALRSIAEVLAATDPNRAERIANSITIDTYKAWALSRVAEVLAATDPDRAERIANSITDNNYAKASALSRVAGMLAATDPNRAELIARSSTGKYAKAWVLSRVAEVLAARSSWA